MDDRGRAGVGELGEGFTNVVDVMVYAGVSINGGTQNGWIIMENPIKK